MHDHYSEYLSAAQLQVPKTPHEVLQYNKYLKTHPEAGGEHVPHTLYDS